MPVKFTLKAARVGNSLKVTIPKEIAEHLGLEKGDVVSMWADDGHIIMEKKAQE